MEQSEKIPKQQSSFQKYLTNFFKFLLFLGVGLTILILVYQNQSEKYLVKCLVDQIDSTACISDTLKLTELKNNIGILDCDLENGLKTCIEKTGFRQEINLTNSELSCLEQATSAEECNLLQKIFNDFRSANYFWLFMMIAIYMISNISRTIRWVMLIKPMGYQPRFINAFCAVMLNYFANLGLPRVGEFVRAGTLAQYENIPIEKLMGTVVTDRIMDVICLIFVMGAAFLIEFDKLWAFTVENMGEEKESGSTLLFFVAIAVFGFLLIYFFRKKIQQLNFYSKIQKILLGFWEGIQTVRNLDKPGWFIFHSLNIWIMYFLMVWVGTFSYEPVWDLGLEGSTVIFAGGTLGIVIPAPGGMGSYQFIVTEILDKIYGIASDEGFSFSNILFFTIQMGGNVVFGLLALLALPLMNKR